MSRKDDPDFMKLIDNHVTLDHMTGQLSLDGIYGNLCINFGHKGGIVVVPYSHVVFYKKNGRWPRERMHLDHINDNPLDNRPENLQELTEEESQKKRRGRMVYRSYGKGKYGYGFYIHHDKRDGRYYVTRQLSRGHGAGDLRNIKVSLGGFNTKESAESKVRECIEEVKLNGLDHLPKHLSVPGRARVKVNESADRIKQLRSEGYTFHQIEEMTGISFGTVYNIARHTEVIEKRKTNFATGQRNAGSKLTEANILEIRKLKTEGRTLDQIKDIFGISKTMVANIVNRKAWSHI